MRSLFLVLSLALGCTPRLATSTADSLVLSDEDRWYATQAALLDPRCYQLDATSAGALDVTVPAGRTWYVTNAFAVTYGSPQFVAQDAYPNSRRSGFLRPLDARRSVALSAGTRVRNNAGINVAYLFRCDPDDVWSLDARYATDPRGLYYGRLARLTSLPISEVVLEVTGGGALTDDVHADLPTCAAVMLIAASVYDTAWSTIGWPASSPATPLNLLSEINNSHAVRFAESILQPLSCGDGLRAAVQKASNADAPGSTDPAIAYPIHGSSNLVYQALPTDW